ncbi:MAG: 50S ribosome-binding GTPase [Candidatus ainarchaeum sp.]|nr:50S ribosome-binding GTPase [Candidatus ainarchaeum sp.]
MQKGFFVRLHRILGQSSLLLEVLDARFPELTRNFGVEKKIINSKKGLVFVLNKADLVEKETLLREKKLLEKISPCVFLSATERKGIIRLREEIGKIIGNKEVVIGIIVYPNTGKSSIINALAKRNAAKVAPKAGFTRGEQFVRISGKIMLIDSPGIIPYSQKNEFELMLVGSKNAEQLHDSETEALRLIEWILKKNPNAIKSNFGIEETDSEKVLEELAAKKGRLLKGGLPDTQTMAKLLIQDWQKAKIKV